MCRIVGYLGGPPVSLTSAVLEPELSLHVQGYSPKEMAGGVVNADGLEAEWYAPGGEEDGASRALAARGRVRTITSLSHHRGYVSMGEWDQV
jgi:hypothetical protein